MNVELLKDHQVAPAIAYIREYRQEHNIPDSLEQYELLLSDETIMEHFHSGKLIFAGCYEAGKLLGTAVLNDTGLLIFFCVKAPQQNIEKLLFDRMIQYCQQKLVRMRITVNAAEPDVPFYHALGFVPYSDKQELNGATFIPLEYIITAAAVHRQKTEPHKGIVFAAILGTCTVLIALLVLLGIQLQKYIAASDLFTDKPDNNTPFWDEREDDTKDKDSFWDDSDNVFDDDANNYFDDSYTDSSENNFDSSQKSETVPQEEKDLDALNTYAAPNLSYTIADDTYTEQESEEGKEINFRVTYPKISSTDNNMPQQEEINSYIRDCAMNTADQTYLAPSEQTKELFADTETYNYFGSEVSYKITYMDDSLISIVFEDHYFWGSIYAEFCDIRTLNINLKTGECYELPDVIKTDSEFTTYWLGRMLAEEPDSKVLAGLEPEQFQKMLEGEFVDNRYYTNFFLDADGFGMGFTYHFRGNDGNLIIRGWMSTSCPTEDIETFAKDSTFWGLLGNPA